MGAEANAAGAVEGRAMGGKARWRAKAEAGDAAESAEAGAGGEARMRRRRGRPSSRTACPRAWGSVCIGRGLVGGCRVRVTREP